MIHRWRPPSLSELTQMIFNTVLTHLGSEASRCHSSIVSIQIKPRVEILLTYSNMEVCKAKLPNSI